VLGLLVSEGGWRRRFPATLLDDVLEWANTPDPLQVAARAAFGVLRSRQEQRLRTAIRTGTLSREMLLRCAYDGEELTRLFDAENGPEGAFRTVDLSGVPLSPHQGGGWYGEPVELETRTGATFRVLVSTETELDQLAWIEPSTTAWLERTLGDASVLYDIGANLGLYCLYASRVAPAAQLVAFEPAPMNVHRMLLNFAINGLAATFVFPFALSDRSGASTFQYYSLVPGASSQPGLAQADVSGGLMAGACVYALDELLAERADLPRPTHLKLDVDGHEFQVLDGAARSLEHPTLSHLLVETSAATLPALVERLARLGFTLEEPGPELFGNAVFARTGGSPRGGR
jgi:FkbM family methyltransferase